MFGCNRASKSSDLVCANASYTSLRESPLVKLPTHNTASAAFKYVSEDSRQGRKKHSWVYGPGETYPSTTSSPYLTGSLDGAQCSSWLDENMRLVASLCNVSCTASESGSNISRNSLQNSRQAHSSGHKSNGRRLRGHTSATLYK